MRKILAATLMIMGAIFVSAYAVCKTIIDYAVTSGGVNELILLLITGLIAIFVGIALFALEYKKK